MRNILFWLFGLVGIFHLRNEFIYWLTVSDQFFELHKCFRQRSYPHRLAWHEIKHPIEIIRKWINSINEYALNETIRYFTWYHWNIWPQGCL